METTEKIETLKVLSKKLNMHIDTLRIYLRNYRFSPYERYVIIDNRKNVAYKLCDDFFDGLAEILTMRKKLGVLKNLDEYRRNNDNN